MNAVTALAPASIAAEEIELEDTDATPGRPLSPQEIGALIERTLPLVQHILFQITAHYPRHADREELAQAATLGLVEAAHRFDASRGVPFERWASLRIRGAIVDSVRALDFAPRSLRAGARSAEEVRAALTNELGRTPTHTEVAIRLGIGERELHELNSRVHRALVLSLDAPCGEEDGDPLTLADSVMEISDVDPVEQLEQRELSAYLGDALELLPARLGTVVRGYFLQGRTSADLAAELGVTESRVSQMRSEALLLMRGAIEAQYDDAPLAPAVSITGRAAARQAAYTASLASHRPYTARLSALPAQRVPEQHAVAV